MKKESVIYVVTTVRLATMYAKGGKEVETSDGRPVGYFLKLEDAVQAIKENYGDIEEAGYYKWAVIERLEPGLYPVKHFDENIWYEFCLRRGNKEYNGPSSITARKIKCPKQWRQTCGWSLG